MIARRRSRGGDVAQFGIRMRLLAANSVVVVVSVATMTLVAALVGPPMFQRLMDAAVRPGATGEHPYQRAFERATATSVGAGLAASAVAAIALSWYLSRRVDHSASELANAAAVVSEGNYDFRLAPTHLGREFDELAVAFNTMAERLGAAERSRRQMLADLAHEIRTPVAILEAYLEALEDGVKQLDEDAIVVLRDQSRRLTRLSIDVGALSDAESRTDAIDVGPVSMTELVVAATAGLQPRYGAKGVTLEVTTPGDLPTVLADRERIEQVLTNLLDNALRHTPNGGSVAVRAHATDDDVMIEVSDTGDGIPGEHVDRLFDRFYRVDAARDRGHGGAGIGLAIAKAFVDGHGGAITAASDGPGRGSTFTFSLPRTPATLTTA